MRNLVLALVVLASTLAFAQQWQTVQGIWLPGQSAGIPLTTIMTPSNPGIYRLTFYISGGGGAATGGFFSAYLNATDISGQTQSTNLGSPCGLPRYISTTSVVSLKVGEPLTYEVDSGNSELGCTFNLAITVEQLVTQ